MLREMGIVRSVMIDEKPLVDDARNQKKEKDKLKESRVEDNNM